MATTGSMDLAPRRAPGLDHSLVGLHHEQMSAHQRRRADPRSTPGTRPERAILHVQPVDYALNVRDHDAVALDDWRGDRAAQQPFLAPALGAAGAIEPDHRAFRGRHINTEGVG